MRGLEARAERREERPQSAELGLDTGDVAARRRQHVAGGATTDERAQPRLGVEPLALEPQRVRVAGGEGPFEGVAAGQGRRRREEGLDLALERGQVFGNGHRARSIIRRTRARSMGRMTHLRAAHDPRPKLVLALVAACAAAALAAPAPAAAAERPLAQRLGQALLAPGVSPGRTGALAVDLRTGATIYARNAELPLVPASNQKLAVAYAALSALGPAYRFHTEVVGRGALVGDVWTGDLVLKGHGDPTLEVADLDALARDVVAWGISRVDGAVVADESWFDARRTAPGWRAQFYVNESPPLSALVVARGWYRGRTSRSPALAAAALLRERLEAHGVRVARPSRAGTLGTVGLPLARDLSVPLARIVRFMGRESDNFTAEMLVKQLGAVAGGSGTTAAGAAVIRRELAAAQVPLAGVRLADGSGLSKLDRLTPSAIVRLLLAGAAADFRDAFLGSLAVAGVAGTLEDRMRSRPARSQVIAKTGTTRLACALSGYVRGRYAFAILHNGSPVATAAARRSQDRFAAILAAAP